MGKKDYNKKGKRDNEITNVQNERKKDHNENHASWEVDLEEDNQILHKQMVQNLQEYPR